MIAEINEPSLEARSLHLAHRVQAGNSLGRRLLVVVLDALVETLLPTLELVQEEGRQMGRHEMRVTALRDAKGNDAMELVRDARGRLDQVIIIATTEHDIAESEALCARCVNEGIKVGAILIGANRSGGSGRTAAAARQYAETIAIVREPETAIEILRAIGV